MDYLPIFVELARRPCLVVGGGAVALRKVRQLLAAGARVTVNAPALVPGLEALAGEGAIAARRTAFDPALVARQFLVIAATDDVEVNTRVYQCANRHSTFVNVVDDPARCSYITPAVVDRSPIIVAISSGGAAPVLARMLRERLEKLLPARLGELARLARSFRYRVKAMLGSLDARRRFWERVFAGPVAEHAYAGRADRARRALAAELAASAGGTTAEARGEVFLVGAGPGDPGLLTIRALQLMQTADIVFHDRLVSPEVLDLVRRDAERVAVGKQARGPSVSQDEINRQLVEHARRGLRVCRLKGGDPFVFGRGGEEMDALVAAGIDFQVVPGITAASGCAAYAGVPLTHREMAQTAVFVTAHCRRSVDRLDWATLARERQTVAFYMPVEQLGLIRRKLLAHGRGAATPVALIENGTRPDQRVIRGTLADLETLAGKKRVASPSMLVVGEVAAMATTHGWFRPAGDPAPPTCIDASIDNGIHLGTGASA